MEPHVEKIHQIFKDYFGEDNVDFIPGSEEIFTKFIVRFPEITVTNENELSTIVYDLFCRVLINNEGGCDKVQFKRTTFTAEHFNSGYIHSHLPISAYRWSSYCWGRGPMATIIADLRAFNSILWEQFCMTLNTTLPVESLAGGPYFKIENLGKKANQNWESYMNVYKSCTAALGSETALVVKMFMEYLLGKNFFTPYLQVRGKEVNFNISIEDLAIFLSKEWEEFFTEVDLGESIYNKYLVSCMYTPNHTLAIRKDVLINIPQADLCSVDFKGRTFAFTILDLENLNNAKKVLAPKIVFCLVNALMTAIYGY